ncbi:MAG: hypothetical protein RIE24_02465 [Silicimonas sp.]
MLEPILITTGPIAASLLALAIYRLRGTMSPETEVVAEYHFAGEEDDASVSVDHADQAQGFWRRSYAK